MPNDLDRAKQFLPFDALKGFREAISTMEEIHEMVCKLQSLPWVHRILEQHPSCI